MKVRIVFKKESWLYRRFRCCRCGKLRVRGRLYGLCKKCDNKLDYHYDDPGPKGEMGCIDDLIDKTPNPTMRHIEEGFGLRRDI